MQARQVRKTTLPRVPAHVSYFVYVTALRFSIDQVVGPLVLGKAGRVSPVLIIFCFLVGGALFGIVGVILAVPVALAIRIALATLYGDMVEAERFGEPAMLHKPGS